MRKLGFIRLCSAALLILAMMQASCGRPSAEGCGTEQVVLARRAEIGMSVVMEAVFCSGIGGGEMEEIVLVNDAGKKRLLLRYEPYNDASVQERALPEPRAMWVSNNELRIEITKVSQVMRRRSSGFGISVKIDIGFEKHPPFWWDRVTW
jgi:hypothetical protein